MVADRPVQGRMNLVDYRSLADVRGPWEMPDAVIRTASRASAKWKIEQGWPSEWTRGVDARGAYACCNGAARNVLRNHTSGVGYYEVIVPACRMRGGSVRIESCLCDGGVSGPVARYRAFPSDGRSL